MKILNTAFLLILLSILFASSLPGQPHPPESEVRTDDAASKRLETLIGNMQDAGFDLLRAEKKFPPRNGLVSADPESLRSDYSRALQSILDEPFENMPPVWRPLFFVQKFLIIQNSTAEWGDIERMLDQAVKTQPKTLYNVDMMLQVAARYGGSGFPPPSKLGITDQEAINQYNREKIISSEKELALYETIAKEYDTNYYGTYKAQWGIGMIHLEHKQYDEALKDLEYIHFRNFKELYEIPSIGKGPHGGLCTAEEVWKHQVEPVSSLLEKSRGELAQTLLALPEDRQMQEVARIRQVHAGDERTTQLLTFMAKVYQDQAAHAAREWEDFYKDTGVLRNDPNTSPDILRALDERLNAHNKKMAKLQAAANRFLAPQTEAPPAVSPAAPPAPAPAQRPNAANWKLWACLCLVVLLGGGFLAVVLSRAKPPKREP